MFLILLILQLCGSTYASTDFAGCLERLQNQEFGQVVEGAVDVNGYSVSNITLAVGLTYSACMNLCGSGHETFDKNLFSQLLAAWFLPWLALISQLPYGGNDALKIFQSMLLTVGSPMLAAYSLALAVNGNRWMVERFKRSIGSNHPKSFAAAKIMSSLQQVLVSLPKDKDKLVLRSLVVVLRENDEWWRRLANGLDYYSSSQWTLAAVMSMVYVGLAYILTWMNTLNSNSNQAYPSGQSLGSLWLALLPLVVCYLQLSPKTDSDRINAALEHVSEVCFTAEEEGKPKQCRSPQIITIQSENRNMVDEDRICPTPVCFYTRFYTWFWTALQLSAAFDLASQRASTGRPVPRTRPEVIEYFSTDSEADNTHYYDLVNIYVKSAMLAIFLQWGTTGAAIMAMYLTPTKGMFGLSFWFSTALWMLVNSDLALLASQNKRKIIGGFAIALRQTGKLLAAVNTAWIFTSTFLQFTNAESNCYCQTSALGLGSKAYGSLVYTPEQEDAAKLYWAGGIIMASGTALAFIIAINILMKQPIARTRVIHGGYEYIPLTPQSTSS
ncbi:hypothetical protein M378DRAFT_16145 [Amanita muscaria Koide BX008]|uniref:Uncharacterized protein n=1 Tax=Amanita muscaria (strain Koide BX008) TaxID=946122 RepID=A0A0C2WMX5_AMAMK|nr:hypothetical protein M378DRAFT_16145 [Amanita muscaria Koide BX008]